MEGSVLRLEIDDGTNEYSWRWKLLDEPGSVLATHLVDLTPADLASTRVLDLYRHLWRIDTDPSRRAASERAILDPIGDFIGVRMLGEIASALARRAPTNVIVRVSPANVRIMGYPLELARYGGASLASIGVTWCYEPMNGQAPSRGAFVGAPLRVLGLFALPIESSAVALVRERRQLARTVESLGGAAQLTVLQYGTTRAALAKALSDPLGWDVIHIAGHGRAGTLNLEREDGSRDRVDSHALASHLATTVRAPALVVLSACETGAARAARRGLAVAAAESAASPPLALDNLGYHVAAGLGCAVAAMRYPVDDRFSVLFTQAFYHRLFAEGMPLDEAFHLSARHAAENVGGPLSLATPVLITPNPMLRLGVPTIAASSVDLDGTGTPAEAEFFVGRTSILTALGGLASPSGPGVGLALIGMPGLGKTAALAEHVAIHGGQFDRVVWHQMKRSHGLAALKRALMVPGHTPPVTVGTVRSERMLIVIDDAHASLNVGGNWRSTDFGEFVEALTAPGGAARIVMASERVLPLPVYVPQVSMPLLSRSEAELLARQLAELHDATDTAPETASAWLVSRGHPGLIVDVFRSADQRREAMRLAADWDVFTPPSPRTVARRKPLARSRIGSRIQAWARARIAEQAAVSAAALIVICSMEASDRHLAMVSTVWTFIADDLGVEVSDADPLLDSTLESAVAVGLVQPFQAGMFLVHPAVAAAVRMLRPDIEDLTVRVMALWWQGRHDKGEDDGAARDELAHFAASAVPYLMRLDEWETASMRAEQAIHHDMSPAMAARLIQFVNEIVIATTDSPLRGVTRFVRATVVGELDAAKGFAAMTQLYEEAEKAGDIALMVGCMTAIANHTSMSNPGQALTFVQRAIEHTAGANVSPAVSIMLRLKAAKLASELGDPDRISASRAREISADLDAHIASGSSIAGVDLPTLRAEILQFAEQVDAPSDREHLDGAYAGLAADGPGAPQRDLIRAQFNTYVGARRRAGDYSTEEVFAAILNEYSETEPERALVLGELADIRWESGNSADALELLRRALRIDYATDATSQAARDHRHFAAILAATGDSQKAAVHLLTAGIINLRISGGLFTMVPQATVGASAWEAKLLIARRPDLVPTSYASLRAAVASDPAVNIDDLLAGSPRLPITVDEETGQITVTWSPEDRPGDSLSDLRALARASPPPAELLDPSRTIQHWSELIQLVATDSGDDGVLARVLGTLDAAGWTRLTRALRDIGSKQASAILTNLDEVETSIVTHCLQLRSGR